MADENGTPEDNSAYKHGIQVLTVHALEAQQKANSRLERVASKGAESVLSDTTGFSSMTASDLTPEGRAVREYLKQPLALRASLEAWEIDPTEIDVTERIGEGRLGILHKARWRNMDVAVKTLRTRNEDGKPRSEVHRESLQQEIDVHSRHRHPNLVMFLGACTQVEPVKIVCEYMPGGSLEGLFLAKRRENRGNKTWQPPHRQVFAWSVDLVRAICFLHMSKPLIVHMDLNPANLLLSSNLTLKVSDFALSRTLKRRKRTAEEMFGSGDAGKRRCRAAPFPFCEHIRCKSPARGPSPSS